MKKVSISNWDEIVAELFRDNGALLRSHWFSVGGDDDGLYLVRMIMRKIMRMMTRRVRMLRMMTTSRRVRMGKHLLPFWRDGDHRFLSWHAQPCRCWRCTCTWEGQHLRQDFHCWIVYKCKYIYEDTIVHVHYTQVRNNMNIWWDVCIIHIIVQLLERTDGLSNPAMHICFNDLCSVCTLQKSIKC